jgi:putative two-component system response regulator
VGLRTRGSDEAVTDRQIQFDTNFTILAVVVTPKVEEEIRAAMEPFGYHVLVIRNGKTAVDLINKRAPDLIVSEVNVPDMNGFELCRDVKGNPDMRVIPFLLITSFYNLEHKVKGFHVGVDDFLYYPFHEMELRARVSSLLRIKHVFSRLQEEKDHLDELVERRTTELVRLNLSLITALEGANRLKDTNTGNHIRRVSEYARVLAEVVGLDSDAVSLIHTYASMHDVGKIGLPDNILKKRGKLTSAEFEEMKLHTVHGYELLKDAGVGEVAQNIARYHHERWDGQGYPDGLKENEIPIEARVVALADVYDALSTVRSYKEAMAHEEARERIVFLAGRHFDPRLTEAFAGCAPYLKQIAKEFSDHPPDE